MFRPYKVLESKVPSAKHLVINGVNIFNSNITSTATGPLGFVTN